MYAQNVLLFAGMAMGHAIRSQSFACGSAETTEEQLEYHRQFAAQEAANRDSGLTTMAAINVQVYLHAISATEGGLSDEATLQSQFETIRAAFAPHDIALEYAGSTRTVNADWANEGNGFEMPMKQALRAGSYQAMNFYIVDELPSASGYCTYPTNAPEGSDAFFRDGCTLAKGAIGPIAVHESGHWFGLIHTFEGDSCDGQGDLVDDTPAQAGPSSGCPVGRDSCPNHPGEDPIHNYMDYTEP
jgi:hypothetical protein